MNDRSALRRLIPYVLLTLAAIILLIPHYFISAGADYGVYFGAGWALTQGLAPYRDFFDHKMPLIYAYTGLWQAVFGSGWGSGWASLIPIYAAFGCAVYTFSTSVLRGIMPAARTIALVTAALSLVTIMRPTFDESLNGSIIALAAAFEWFALASWFRGRFAWAGGLAVLALFTRQTALIPFAFVAWTLIQAVRSREPLRLVAYRQFAVGAAVALMGAAAIFSFMRLDVQSFIASVFGFNVFYSGGYLNDVIGVGGGWATLILQESGWIVLAIMGLVLLPDVRSRVLPILAFATLFILLPLKPADHYKIQVIPSLYLLALSGIAALRFTNMPQARRLIAVGVAVWIGLSVLQDSGRYLGWIREARAADFNPAALVEAQMAERIRALTTPDERIFVYGNRVWYHILSERRSVSRFYYYYPSTTFERSGAYAELLRDFETTPPALVVLWDRPRQAENELQAYLDRRCTPLADDQQVRGGGQILLCQTPNSDEVTRP